MQNAKRTMQHDRQKKRMDKGFTLVETMVAVSIFAIVVTVGIASLVSLNAAYKSARRDRAVMDGVSSAIERMAREIKTGYQYACEPLTFAQITPASPDCQNVESFGFYATQAGSATPTIYALDNGVITLFADDGVQVNPVPITPEEVTITNLAFTLVGNAPGGDQPYVIIRVEGETTATGAASHFALQTTVDQRLPDISGQ